MKVRLSRLRIRMVTAIFMVALSGASFAEQVQLEAKAVTIEKEALGIGDKASEYIRDYLSDPRRSGSLAGSILGGALSAHPVGPILGSVVGFMIGKQTMFNEDKSKADRAAVLYARRDIVPMDGAGQSVQKISFDTNKGINFDRPGSETTFLTTVSPTAIGSQASVRLTLEQISAICGGQSVADPRLKAMCFYSQGS